MNIIDHLITAIDVTSRFTSNKKLNTLLPTLVVKTDFDIFKRTITSYNAKAV